MSGLVRSDEQRSRLVAEGVETVVGDLDDQVEHCFTVKKQADSAVTRSGLDWLLLRPSLLTDEPRQGTVSLGPEEMHDQIVRADVADTLAALLHESRINARVLELIAGSVEIGDAVRSAVKESSSGVRP